MNKKSDHLYVYFVCTYRKKIGPLPAWYLCIASQQHSVYSEQTQPRVCVYRVSGPIHCHHQSFLCLSITTPSLCLAVTTPSPLCACYSVLILYLSSCWQRGQTAVEGGGQDADHASLAIVAQIRMGPNDPHTRSPVRFYKVLKFCIYCMCR